MRSTAALHEEGRRVEATFTGRSCATSAPQELLHALKRKLNQAAPPMIANRAGGQPAVTRKAPRPPQPPCTTRVV